MARDTNICTFPLKFKGDKDLTHSDLNRGYGDKSMFFITHSAAENHHQQNPGSIMYKIFDKNGKGERVQRGWLVSKPQNVGW